MLKWFKGAIFGGVLASDISAANDFVEKARRKIKEATNREEMALAFAEGLEFMVENLVKHLRADRERVLSAKGFDNNTLDKVYRWLLGGAEKVNPLLREPSPTAQYEGLKMSFGCLVLSHVYRLRFLETQVSGEKLQAVEAAMKNVQTLMHGLLTMHANRPVSAS